MVAVAILAALLHYELDTDILYVEKEVVLPGSRAKVFLYISDMKNNKFWQPDIDSFEPIDESIMGVGKDFIETSHVMLYGNLTSTCTVLSYEPPRYLSYTCDSWLTRPRIEMVLEYNNDDSSKYPTTLVWREYSRRRSYFFNYAGAPVVGFVYSYIRRQALFSLRFLLQDR
jgi:uncharacterized protein YndB with AHSA1/START domain